MLSFLLPRVFLLTFKSHEINIEQNYSNAEITESCFKSKIGLNKVINITVFSVSYEKYTLLAFHLMINRKKLFHLISMLMLTTFLVACGDSPSSVHVIKNKLSKMQCLEQQSLCHFDMAGGRVAVLFDVNKVIAEQAFNMSVNYTGSAKIISVKGYMEGVEMFMGKIPLFLETVNTKSSSVDESKAQEFQGEIFVGSCSADKMTWRVWLTFTMADQQTHSKMFTLVSHRS